MNLNGNMSAVVTGGASGLGLATAHRLVGRGFHVVICDLSEEHGAAARRNLGESVSSFVRADVCDPLQMAPVFDAAEARAPLRALVHCAGSGGRIRLVESDGSPGSLETFEAVVRTNLVGSFNVLRLAAARMARNEVIDGERGACVLTASIAAWDGQIGQIGYASAKAGVAGMTLVAARDLASKLIRVCTIAPGIFDTPMLARLPENVRSALEAAVPHPSRMGRPDEFALTAMHILENAILNGETIRLDGAIRMQPR
jgi:NAD(P)-dependent dehydrogenase (short-subunit alcohol dehydrogenase family)